MASDGTVLRINDTELAWLGLDREAVAGRLNYADLLTPQSRAVFEDTFARFKRSGVVQNLHLELVAGGGTALPVLVSAKAVYDHDGRFVMSRSTVLNLTQQLRAQEQMEQALSKHFKLLKKAPIKHTKRTLYLYEKTRA